MKKLSLIFLVAIFAIPLSLRAQWAQNYYNGDTVWVAAGANDVLSNLILGDTTALGARVHHVYVLERGQTYINTQSISTNGYHLTIIGEPATADTTLPVIQATTANSGYPPGDIIAAYGDLTLDHVWVLAWVFGTTSELWEPVHEYTDGAHIWINGCVFEWSQGPFIHILANATDTYLTNNLFRNSIDGAQWWAGRVIYHEPKKTLDSLVVVNNTCEQLGWGFLQTQGDSVLGAIVIDHNTTLYICKFNLQESFYRNAFIGNNLFVNCHFTGERVQDANGQDPDGLLYGQILNVDTITVGSVVDPKEALRVIHFENNASYFDTAYFNNFYRTWNDTVARSTGRTLYAEPIFNTRTAAIWDPSVHPLFVFKNNYFDNSGVPTDDPTGLAQEYYGINPQLTKEPYDPSGEESRDVRIWPWLTNMFTIGGSGGSEGLAWYWGYDPDSLNYPSGYRGGPPDYAQDLTIQYANASGTTYPDTEDFSYSNSALKTGGMGGYPIGDLNWFPAKLAAFNAAGGYKVVDNSLLAVKELPGKQVPNSYKLGQNYPNPFNPTTEINYSVPQNGFVTLEVFNVLGQEVATLFSGVQHAGNYVASFDATKFASGVYFYRLQAGSFSVTKKMVLLK